mgnify:CR=1 FL=1
MKLQENSILFEISNEVDSMNSIEEKNYGYKYTPKSSYCFKSIILNRSIHIGDSYYYFGFSTKYKAFYIFLERNVYPDEYLTEYSLLDNVNVTVTAEKDDADEKYILYIDIVSLN